MATIFYGENENPQVFANAAAATATTLSGFEDGVGSTVYVETLGLFYIDNDAANPGANDLVLDDATGVLKVAPKQNIFMNDSDQVSLNNMPFISDTLTTVGGAAAEAFTISGLVATDEAFVQIVDNGTSNVTALQAVVTADTLTVTFSADPVADTVFNYFIVKKSA